MAQHHLHAVAKNLQYAAPRCEQYASDGVALNLRPYASLSMTVMLHNHKIYHIISNIYTAIGNLHMTSTSRT
jgi:hypothetical protein